MSLRHSIFEMTTLSCANGQVLRRSRSRSRLASALLVAMLGLPRVAGVAHGASSSAEQNWPQWRGPLQNGVAPRADPPTEWSESKNVKWKVKIPGEGTATPVIWDNRIFVLSAIPTGKKVESKPDDPSTSEQNPRQVGAARD